MRRSILILGVAAFALLVANVSLAATAADAPENVTIDQCMDKQAAVEFTHKAHWDRAECTACHHTQEGLTAESDMEVESCISCHKDPAEAETPNCTEMSLRKNPYHVNCVDCHKTEAAGPTKCTECHPKG